VADVVHPATHGAAWARRGVDRDAAEIAAVGEFKLNDEQRKRRVIQKYSSAYPVDGRYWRTQRSFSPRSLSCGCCLFRFMVSFGDTNGGRSQVISLRDVVAGVLIGAAAPSWGAVAISAVAWPFIAWGYINLFAGGAAYKPGTPLFSSSEAVTRFIIWGTTAAATSLIVACIVYGARLLWS
jgi:hypothetical protein